MVGSGSISGPPSSPQIKNKKIKFDKPAFQQLHLIKMFDKVLNIHGLDKI
jgi:hypothetical protein